MWNKKNVDKFLEHATNQMNYKIKKSSLHKEHLM